jgi:hypothetical protein
VTVHAISTDPDLIPRHLRVLPATDEVNELRCYDADEVAALIGMSPEFVKKAAREGHLPRIMFGTSAEPNRRKMRFRHDTVRDWLKSLED